jgi:hypothetical protein
VEFAVAIWGDNAGVAASWMRVFRTCPVHDRRWFRGGLSRINSRSADVQGSLVVGKNAGNFAESAVFWQNPSLKPILTQLLAYEFREHHEMLSAIVERNAPHLREIVRAHILQPRPEAGDAM